MTLLASDESTHTAEVELIFVHTKKVGRSFSMRQAAMLILLHFESDDRTKTEYTQSQSDDS